MSYQATGRVLRWRRLTPSEKAVAYTIAHHENSESGVCTAANGTIAIESGYKDVDSVKKVIRKLKKKRVISEFGATTGGRHNTVPRHINEPSAESEKGVQADPLCELVCA